jgi:hypothetical protein
MDFIKLGNQPNGFYHYEIILMEIIIRKST